MRHYLKCYLYSSFRSHQAEQLAVGIVSLKLYNYVRNYKISLTSFSLSNCKCMLNI